MITRLTWEPNTGVFASGCPPDRNICSLILVPVGPSLLISIPLEDSDNVYQSLNTCVLSGRFRPRRPSDVPLGLGSNPGEDMDVCKCIMPSRHRGTLNSRRAASPFVRLVEGEERWEAPEHPQGVLPQNWGETELNRSVSCMVLKATTNDRRHLARCHDEFRVP
ncbi:cullin-4A [Trichonephila clavipes]|uniref:Cullin-4A n=1 Tax=Trichonephila clavipes TaxID=2585209 RepID=A0A8X6W9H1_TRICX|nr:cullin-4A [Trichonephila clavipes]